MKAGEHFEFLSDDRAIRIKISHARWSSKFVCAEQDIKQGLDMLIGIEGPPAGCLFIVPDGLLMTE